MNNKLIKHTLLNILLVHKKKILCLSVISILLIAEMIFMKGNYALYRTTIATVKHVNTVYQKTEEGPRGEKEKFYKQTLVLLIRNGEHQGNTVTIENEYSYSQIMSTQYKVNEDVFLRIKSGKSGIKATITGVKRDVYFAFIVTVFLLGILILARKQGLLTLISLGFNVFIFMFLIQKYMKGEDFHKISYIMILSFSVFTLFILGGISKKTIGAILSTLITVVLIDLTYELVIRYVEKPPYELMDYIIGPADLSKLFSVGVIIGCLGAVMDVAITIHSSVYEIVATTKDISLKKLIRSVREIGYDIMGTMINVLLFTYLSGSLPILIIKVKNGYTLNTLLNFNVIFEAIRFSVGSIGIVSAIPISGLVAILITKGFGRKNASAGS